MQVVERRVVYRFFHRENWGGGSMKIFSSISGIVYNMVLWIVRSINSEKI